MKNDPLEMLRLFHAELVHIRRDIHAHPELGFEEKRTSHWWRTSSPSTASKCTAGSPRPAWSA